MQSNWITTNAYQGMFGCDIPFSHSSYTQKEVIRKTPTPVAVVAHQNLVCIGDNLQWLCDSRLHELYRAIKVIYIDPPYNTKTEKTYGDKMSENAWLQMITQRIAKSIEFLTDDGVMFISIDDNEYAELKVACDKLFGKQNFLGTFITRQSQRSNAEHINVVHEYVLCYAKNKDKAPAFKLRRMDIPEDRKLITDLSQKIKDIFRQQGREKAQAALICEIKRITEELHMTWLKNYCCLDDDGNIFFAKDLSTPGTPREVNIPEINLHLAALPTRNWSADAKFVRLYHTGKLAFKGNRPYEKHLLTDAEDNAPSILNFYSRQGTHDLDHLGLYGVFDTPKPVALIKFLLRMAVQKDDIVMDFFAGSGTTAQAVYELNEEKNLNLHFVLIQRHEPISEKTGAQAKCLELGITPDIAEVLQRRLTACRQKINGAAEYMLLTNENANEQ